MLKAVGFRKDGLHFFEFIAALDSLFGVPSHTSISIVWKIVKERLTMGKIGYTLSKRYELLQRTCFGPGK